jgi:hypothetical protein
VGAFGRRAALRVPSGVEVLDIVGSDEAGADVPGRGIGGAGAEVGGGISDRDGSASVSMGGEMGVTEGLGD